MKILILGGTGAMGAHLVKLLNDKDYELFVTSRSERLAEGNVKYIQGNAKDLNFIEPLLKSKWDVIVDFMVYTTPMFVERVNLFLDATTQYVYLSSARVYANCDKLINENSPRLIDISEDKEYLKTDEYALSKARQENVLINSGKKNWTIIRPYITYSEYRMQLGVLEKEAWLYRALKGRTIVFSQEINSKLTTLTYGFDLSKAMKELIGKKDALGEVYHITTTNPKSWNEILNVYLSVLEKHLGFRPKILLQDTTSFIEHHGGKYQVIYDRAFNRKFENSKIAKYIDVSQFTEIEYGLKTCLEEFLKKPNFKLISWKSEALKDKQTKEFTSLKEIQGIKQKIKYLLFRFF